MAGERTIKIKFTGDTKGLGRSAAVVEQRLNKFGDNVSQTTKRIGANFDDAFKKFGDGIDQKGKGFFGKVSNAFSGIGKGLLSGLDMISDALPGAVGKAMSALPPQGQALAIVLVTGLAAALAPMLGAAISAALLVGLGGGVLAAGIALVAKTPEVKSAFGKFKDSLFDQDTSDITKKIEAAQARLDKATYLKNKKAIKAAKYDLELAKAQLAKVAITNTFNKSLKDLAQPFIAPLVRAAQTFTDGINKLKPAIGAMFAMVAPVIDKLAPGLVGFFEKLMPGMESAVAASVPLLETLAFHLPLLGNALSRMFDSIASGGPGANKFFSDFLYFVEGLLIAFGGLIGMLSRIYGKIRAFFMLIGDGFDNFKDAVRNGLSYVEEGFVLLRLAAIDEFAKILDGADRALGWLPIWGDRIQTAKNLFGQLREDANRDLQAIRDKRVKIEAFSNVGSIANSVANALARIPSTKRINIQVYSNIGSVAAQVASTLARIPRRASGGPVSAGRSYLVGERGPEVLTMGSGGNGNVTPNRDLDKGGDVYEFTFYLADEVKKVFRGEMRDLKRRSVAAGATA